MCCVVILLVGPVGPAAKPATNLTRRSLVWFHGCDQMPGALSAADVNYTGMACHAIDGIDEALTYWAWAPRSPFIICIHCLQHKGCQPSAPLSVAHVHVKECKYCALALFSSSCQILTGVQELLTTPNAQSPANVSLAP